MRVVMVSKALVVGAYQRKLEELARLPGVELTAVVPPAWRDRRGAVALDRAFTAGYRLIVAPLAFNGLYHLHYYPTLGRLLRELRPDVLHMDEEPYNLATWHGIRLGQQAGARSLFFTWQNLHKRYPWPFRHFERANYRRAAYAIAGNRDAEGVLRDKGYQGPLAVIPQFGVDPELFLPAAPADKPAGPARAGEMVIGYAGGLIPEKGVELLLRACGGLSGVRWSLLVAGDGPDRRRLEGLAADLGVQGQVRFLGLLPSTALPAFYRRLDVFVLPSLTAGHWAEQFGRVLIEAMSCGVPVVGSTSREIPNVIGDAGLVFPEGDAAALQEALRSLAGDGPLRQALARRGRERVLARFTQAQVAAATYRVYCEMMGSQP